MRLKSMESPIRVPKGLNLKKNPKFGNSTMNSK